MSPFVTKEVFSIKSGVFTGLVGLDMVYYQEGAPSENKKSKTNQYHVFVGGPAANAAITYAMLGGKSRLITCIGDSELGKIIKKELTEDYGIEVIDLAENDDVNPNISSISVNLLNASRTIWSGQQNFSINRSFDLTEVFSDAAFCFSDCNLFDVAVPVLEKAKMEKKPIVLDAGSWKDKFEVYLSLADDVIASADCKPPNGCFIDAAMEHGVRNIAVTHGENRILWRDPSNSGTIQPPKVDAIDTLGAGDIFHGAYCYFRFVRNFSFQDSLSKAAVVASLSVKYIGPRTGVKEYLKISEV